MRTEMLTPAHLQHGDTHMKILLDGPPVTKGHVVSLKEDEMNTMWQVVETWPAIPRENIKRGWNNNI